MSRPNKSKVREASEIKEKDNRHHIIKQKCSRQLLGLLLVIVLIFGGFDWVLASEIDTSQANNNSLSEIEAGLAKIREALITIYENYPGDFDIDDFVKGAVDGAVGVIGDRHSSYYTDEDMQALNESVDNEFIGIGVHIEGSIGYPRVIKPLENSPAMRAGIQADDMIIAINGVDLGDFSVDYIAALIRGPVGTRVDVTVRRGVGDAAIEYTYTVDRELIINPSVNMEVIGDVAHFQITTFGEHTYDELVDAHAQLVVSYPRNFIKGYILDVRDNSGGRLDSVFDVANLFLNKKVMFRMVDKNGQEQIYSSHGGGLDIPLVVLMNKKSASASELLAGALGDNGVATLIGSKTYGKGTVQELIPLASGGYMRITTARYYTPLGHEVDGLGITPDLRINDSHLQLIAALEYLSPSEELIITTLVADDKATIRNQNLEVKDLSFYFMDNPVPNMAYRYTMEALGYQVDWDEEAKRSTVHNKGRRIQLDLSGNIYIDNELLDTSQMVDYHRPVYYYQGSAYMDVSLLAKLFDLELELTWEDVVEAEAELGVSYAPNYKTKVERITLIKYNGIEENKLMSN